MNLVLYHSVESTCAQKVRLVLVEKKLDWQEIRLNLRRGDQFSPEYLKLNPKAVVPTLVHDQCVVRESTVINEYLEDRFPEPGLRPLGAGDRASMRLLIKTIDDEVHPAIGVLSYATFLRHQMNERMSAKELADHFSKVADPSRRERQLRTHKEGLQSPAAAQAVAALARFVVQLADGLDDRPWLAGSNYSLADAAAIPYMVRAQALHLAPLWAELDSVSVWLERALERSARLPLTDPWGSSSFHTMVAGHADAAAEEIDRLLPRPDKASVQEM